MCIFGVVEFLLQRYIYNISVALEWSLPWKFAADLQQTNALSGSNLESLNSIEYNLIS